MNIDIFTEHFEKASHLAHDFARRFIIEQLPDRRVFLLHLNASYDESLKSDEIVFPADSSIERRQEMLWVDEAKVVEVLYRGGRVPEWIDLSVVGKTGTETIIQAFVCGRFTNNDDLLYHKGEGHYPFHVTGPTLPPSYSSGDDEEEEDPQFSIYLRSVCVRKEELFALEEHAEEVWSLELLGSDFSDAVIERLPKMKHCQIVEVRHGALEGSGLTSLKQARRLNVLRINTAASTRLSLSNLPRCKGVTLLDLTDVPADTEGLGRVAEAFPKLTSLTISSLRDLPLPSALPKLPRLEDLTLNVPSLDGAIEREKLPRLSSLYLRSEHRPSGAFLASLLAYGRLDQLSIEAKTFDDHDLMSLSGLRVSRLSVVRCNTSKEARERFREDNPDIELLPLDNIDCSR